MPVKSFYDPTHGRDNDDIMGEMIADIFGDLPKPQGVGDWPRVHTAIRRDGLFIVETSTLSFMARLSFCPEQTDAGDYEIRYLHRPVRLERGRVVEVKPVAENEKDVRLSMLTPFPTRYKVDTVGSDRPHEKRVWLVGLNSFRIVDETDGSVSDS